MVKIDEKNCLILNILQKDCRTSLTDISKRVGLSVDSVKKRIQKMVKEGIFSPKIRIRPRAFGFHNIVDVKIKLQDYNSSDIKNFTEFLIDHSNVSEIFTTSGGWDFSIVIFAKDALDLGRITQEIRNKFSKIIKDWSESLTTRAYKFEDYDMLKLMGFKTQALKRIR